MPASCTITIPGSAPADPRCPDPTRLAGGFNGVDFPAGTTITTYVRDNGAGSADFYDPAATPGQPVFDANDDSRMWVRVDATVHGRTRRLVALVRLERNAVALPRKAVLAGKIATSNQGKKVIFNTQGSAAEAVPIAVRCVNANDTACVGVNRGKGQIAPDTLETGAPSTPALTPAALAQLISEADRAGTHYATCPPVAALTTPAPVVIDAGNCSYTANGRANTAEEPGLLIIRNGTLSLGGNFEYHGIVYALNQQGSTGWVVQTGGTALIQGAVFVDGAGGVMAGSSKQNVVYNDKAFARLKVAGDGSIVRNTWRELPSS
jgi:predicted extracellular nuclease